MVLFSGILSRNFIHSRMPQELIMLTWLKSKVICLCSRPKSSLKSASSSIHPTNIVEFVGCIDEDADFKELLGLEQRHITFDFNQVSMINSCGIREWIKFLERIPEKSTMTYTNCPQIIIEQINM